MSDVRIMKYFNAEGVCISIEKEFFSYFILGENRKKLLLEGY